MHFAVATSFIWVECAKTIFFSFNYSIIKKNTYIEIIHDCHFFSVAMLNLVEFSAYIANLQSIQ